MIWFITVLSALVVSYFLGLALVDIIIHFIEGKKQYKPWDK